MKEDLRIAEQAAQWLVRLEEDPHPVCRQAFGQWLEHSPSHMEAFLLTEASYSKLDGVDPHRRIDIRERLARNSGEVIDLPKPGFPPLPRKRWVWALTAASLACAGILGWLTFFFHPFSGAQVYATAIGEQRSFSLADGSVIHLNARSQVEVDYSEQTRQIRMLDGQALFVVARDPARPFRVKAGTAIVQAVGTQFDVNRHKDRTTVSVIEGQVQVLTLNSLQTRDALYAPMLLAAGEEAQVTPGRIVKRTSANPAQAIAWRQRQMVFRSDTLADIAEQVNRYSRVQVQIDPAIASRRLSGVFNVDDLDSLLAFLNANGDLSFDHDVERGRITIRAW